VGKGVKSNMPVSEWEPKKFPPPGGSGWGSEVNAYAGPLHPESTDDYDEGLGQLNKLLSDESPDRAVEEVVETVPET